MDLSHGGFYFFFAGSFCPEIRAEAGAWDLKGGLVPPALVRHVAEARFVILVVHWHPLGGRRTSVAQDYTPPPMVLTLTSDQTGMHSFFLVCSRSVLAHYRVLPSVVHLDRFDGACLARRSTSKSLGHEHTMLRNLSLSWIIEGTP